MKISVFGTGYVGLVTGLCFAEMGNDVTCVDKNKEKVQKLEDGVCPIYEPGLATLLKNNIKDERIHFTSEPSLAIRQANILFIAIGTPPAIDGSADLNDVLSVATTIAEEMSSYKLIVTKSTVPIGTHKKIRETIQKTLDKRGVKIEFDVASNPEFLREGNAVEDCLRPNRIIIGVNNAKSSEVLSELYIPFLKNGNPMIVMDPFSAEMTKYAANAMLATKISIMNELSRICEKTGADIEAVRKGIGSDQRIGPHFIYAGVGYGGSCFPKDVSALIHIGRSVAVDTPILNSVEAINKSQRDLFFQKILKNMGTSVKDKTFGIWGVAFKPGTDDIREAPALDLIEKLLANGARVLVYDPAAKKNAMAFFNNPNILFLDNQYSAIKDVDALCIMTEWPSFREPDFQKMKTLMKSAMVFDGRNIYAPKTMRKNGFSYHCVGRPYEE